MQERLVHCLSVPGSSQEMENNAYFFFFPFIFIFHFFFLSLFPLLRAYGDGASRNFKIVFTTLRKM